MYLVFGLHDQIHQGLETQALINPKSKIKRKGPQDTPKVTLGLATLRARELLGEKWSNVPFRGVSPREVFLTPLTPLWRSVDRHIT